MPTLVNTVAAPRATVKAVDTAPAHKVFPGTISGAPVSRNMEEVPDEVLLSTLMTMADPSLDGDAMAHRLLSGHRTLEDAVSAIASGAIGTHKLDARARIRFCALTELSARLVRPSLARHPVVVQFDSLVTYCRLRASCASVQQIRLLFLDERKHLITDELHQTGTADSVSIYLREVIRRALDLNACSIVIVHSSPREYPPSQSDSQKFCERFQQAATPMGIDLYEYMLIGRKGYQCLIQQAKKTSQRKCAGVDSADDRR